MLAKPHNTLDAGLTCLLIDRSKRVVKFLSDVHIHRTIAPNTATLPAV